MNRTKIATVVVKYRMSILMCAGHAQISPVYKSIVAYVLIVININNTMYKSNKPILSHDLGIYY